MQQISGKIIQLLDAREGVAKSTGNKWMSQQFLVETQEQFPKKILLDLFGEDKIHLYNLQVGETVTVNFTVNAREYNGRWYNTLSVSNINKEVLQPPITFEQPPTDDLDAIFGSSNEVEDVIPF